MMTEASDKARAPKEIDFTKLENVRKAALLTKAQMADYLKVTRQTYYSWVSGRSVPQTNMKAVIKPRIRVLLALLAEGGWPTPVVCQADQKDRLALLLAELGEA